MFKRFVVTGIAACAGLVLSLSSLPAAAYMLDVKVGQVDSKSSGDGAELAEIEKLTGLDLTLDEKIDIKTAILNPGSTDEWYIDVAPATPGYFAVKFGVGGLGFKVDTFFFRNIGELDKLVFSNADILGIGDGCEKCNIERISHYTTFNGGSHTVPEPLPLTLLGIGIAGMLLSRRRRHS